MVANSYYTAAAVAAVGAVLAAARPVRENESVRGSETRSSRDASRTHHGYGYGYGYLAAVAGADDDGVAGAAGGADVDPRSLYNHQ